LLGGVHSGLYAQTMHNMSPKCVWAASIFLEKKMDWGAKGRQGKEEEATTSFIKRTLLGSYLFTS